MADRHSLDEYLETIYFLAFPIGEYRPQGTGSPPLASRVAEMLGVSRASAGEMLKRLEAEGLAEHDGDLLHWFYDQGLVPGREVEVRAAEPAAGQVTVRLNGDERAIGDKAAEGLYVRRA